MINSVKSEFEISLRDSTSRGAASIRQSLEQIKTSTSSLIPLLKGLAAGFSVFQAASTVKGAINTIDQLNRLSKIAGVTAEEFSGLAYAAELADVSNASFANGLKFLGKNMDEAARGSKSISEMFGRIGVSVKDASGNLRSVSDVFVEAADAISKLPPGAQRAAIAMKLFGRAGADLLPLLEAGGAGIREMVEEAEKLGKVFDDETGKAADDFNDNLTRLKAATDGLVLSMAQGMLPTLVDITNAAAEGAKQFGLLGAAYAAAREAFAQGFERFGVDDLEDKREQLDDLIDRLKYLRGETWNGKIDKWFNDLKGNDRAGEIAKVTAEINKLNDEILTLQRVAEDEAKPRKSGKSKGGGAIAGVTADAEEIEKKLKKEADELKADTQAVRNYLQDYAREREANFARESESTRKNIESMREAVATPAERAIKELAEYQKAFGADSEEFGRKAVEVFNELNPEVDELAANTKRAQEAAKELGLTFTSAFEDAMLEGAKLSDVLNGLAKDIGRVFLRNAVTNPIIEAASGMFAKGGSFSGITDFFTGLFSNAQGGLYKVAGGGGGERPIAFTAQPGEYVAVGRANANASTSSEPVVVNVIGAPSNPRVSSRAANGRRQIDLVFTDAAGSAASAGMLMPLGINPPLVPR